MATDRDPAKGSASPDPVPGSFFTIDIGEPLGYFTEVDGLTLEYDVYEYKEGGVNDFVHKLRGRVKYPNLVLKRGVTHEGNLLKWFLDCQEQIQRRSLIVTLLGPNQSVVRRWSFAEAYPVKWTGPSLKASSGEAAVESLEVAHQGLMPE